MLLSAPLACPGLAWTGLQTDSWLPNLLVRSPSVIKVEEGESGLSLTILDIGLHAALYGGYQALLNIFLYIHKYS